MTFVASAFWTFGVDEHVAFHLRGPVGQGDCRNCNGSGVAGRSTDTYTRTRGPRLTRRGNFAVAPAADATPLAGRSRPAMPAANVLLSAPHAAALNESAAAVARSAAERVVEREIHHAAHLLPTQGPLSVFVHHNTLHAFEDLPFAEAVARGADVYGCEPYLAEEEYRRQLAHGRIRTDDLAAVLHDDLGDRADDLIGLLGTRFHLRLAMLQFPLQQAPLGELQWVVAETDALRHFRADVPEATRERTIASTRRWILRDFGGDVLLGAATSDDRATEAAQVVTTALRAFGNQRPQDWTAHQWEAFTVHLLWEVCNIAVQRSARRDGSATPPVRHRDALLAASGRDSDELVHDVLVRFCSEFLDQGFAQWPLLDRERGFYAAFLALYGQSGAVLPRWMRGLPAELRRLRANGVDPLACIAESLEVLGVSPSQRPQFIEQSLLALRGWAGMIWQLESAIEWAVRPAPPGSLVEFLAIRLLLDRWAVAHVAEQALPGSVPLDQVIAASAACRLESDADCAAHVQRVYLFFQLAQLLGLKPEEFLRLPLQTWGRLADEVDAFSELERRRTLHLAYERAYRTQALDALASYAGKRRQRRPPAPAAPSFQLITCIDDREESFRRHLEETDPECETFAYAGFFGVAMYYRGAADAHARPLCPIVIKPQHWVAEVPVVSMEQRHDRRSRARRLLGAALHRVHWGSRSILGGAATALFGSLASIPLVARILFPRLAGQIRGLAGSFVQPPLVTQLRLERAGNASDSPDEARGYTLGEMAEIVERTLRDMGLTSPFARLVIICGHGSGSLNNPHESAYNCGAAIAARGLEIPDDTHFLGAWHNTCDETVEYFDLDRVPPSHRSVLAKSQTTINEARARNAQERCRRFRSADLEIEPPAALRHVQARAEDLSQVRPEYNHATCAMCIVGRRASTKGLFLDRRSFLVSYNASDDPSGAVLARLLGAAIPVCAGISLEYYFSRVDVAGYGCGSKLPHNITSLLGVMEGAASDLRTGLSAQMVEIHEPMRLLFVVEATPEVLERTITGNPVLARLCRNEWSQFATLADDGTIHLYRAGRFEPYTPTSSELPTVGTSREWYRGERDHLGFAAIARSDHAIATPGDVDQP
jgi:uncharacterized protein YbcC (UPF0753/DUF2309 family)